MWSFGVGLFLIELAPESLRLTATYGFSSGGAILLFGAIVGDWVDNTPRLKAARMALIIQNLTVVVCAVVVFLVYYYNAELTDYWPEKRLLLLLHAVIIIIAIVANLSSIARKIAIEKDWLVEICGSDKDLLASMSATMRCIDQTSMILSPALTGQVIAYANLGYGAIFIAAWNLFSVVIEYYMIWKVYDNVPALRNKMYRKRKDKDKDKNVDDNEANGKETPFILKNDGVKVEGGNTEPSEGQNLIGDKEKTNSEEIELHVTLNKNSEEEIETKSEITCVKTTAIVEDQEHTCKDRCMKILRWRIYIRYDVAFAGLGLACLYMTVLGFDNITVGYAYSQGLNESLLGGLMAAGAISGILGTVVYPFIRRHIGIERTGLFGLGAEILVLCACVAGIWAPGSPFDPFYFSREKAPDLSVTQVNTSDAGPLYNISSNNQNSTSVQKTGPDSYLSVGLILGGIIAARFGLWLSDLTISQLFLENVVETERGIVNGVQSSLNKLMDMLKFLLVILVPQPELFGFLILISFMFICLGWVFYARYSHSVRGHLFHFDKMRKCLDTQNNNAQEIEIEVTNSADT
ncbi:hypothetical protein KUTeg_008652 [Tegillarca granosa]|uniref:Solute carrier family 40 member n=1 Tax=Tegillarca granosa TaxID=220873 RepID=A0ABQ9F9S3_TEGGR|nr:hypothetical protein KUTeg_008652 [Tegillarca granosa]